MISVIMSTYKEPEEQLRKSIESILNQTYNNFEFIILLDFPNNDLHKEIIESYSAKDSRIRFFINEHNLGLVGSLNRGLSLAQGDFIARMDADDISLPERFEKQMKYLLQNDYDLIGGITQMIDENESAIYSIRNIPSDFNKIKKALKYGQCIAHPTWLAKKTLFDHLGGYRNIPLCEDYDFTLRAVLSGYKVSNLNEVILKYRMTSNSLSRNNLYEQYLYMRFITKAYTNGKVANISEATKFVQGKNDSIRSRKYLKANVLFNALLRELENKQFCLFIRDGFKLLFCSKDYLNKIYRFAMLSINS